MVRLCSVCLFRLADPSVVEFSLWLVWAQHTEEFISIPVELDISALGDQLIDGELQRIDAKDRGGSGDGEQSIESGTACGSGSAGMQTHSSRGAPSTSVVLYVGLQVQLRDVCKGWRQ